MLSVAFSPDGTYLASGGMDHTVRVWDRRSGAQIRLLQPSFLSQILGRTEAIAFHPGGSRLASGGHLDSKIRIWDWERQLQLRILTGHSLRGAWSVDYSPDGKTIASAGADGTVRLWEAESGASLGHLGGDDPGLISDVLSVAFSPDGKVLASAGWDKLIHLWQMPGGEPLRDLRGHEMEITSLAFSPDGRQLASGSSDSTVRLWDTQSGALVSTLQGHSGIVFTVAYSPDGQHIASGGTDAKVRLWATGSDEQPRVLGEHAGYVYALAFSPKGGYLASGADKAELFLWNVGSGDLALKLGEKQVTVPGGKPPKAAPLEKPPGPTHGERSPYLGWAIVVLTAALAVAGYVFMKAKRLPRHGMMFSEGYAVAARMEADDPRQALRLYNELERANESLDTRILVLAVGCPALAGLIDITVRHRFDVPEALLTLGVWFYIGFVPVFRRYYRRLRDERRSLSPRPRHVKEGIDDRLFVHFVMPLAAFFQDGLMLATEVIVIVVAWLAAMVPAGLLRMFLTGGSPDTVIEWVLAQVGLPCLLILFVLVPVAMRPNPARIFSPASVWTAIRLNYPAIFGSYGTAFLLLCLGSGLTTRYSQYPVLLLALALMGAILKSIAMSHGYKDLEAATLLQLGKIRCLLRLGKKRDVEWHLYQGIATPLAVLEDFVGSISYTLRKQLRGEEPPQYDAEELAEELPANLRHREHFVDAIGQTDDPGLRQ